MIVKKGNNGSVLGCTNYKSDGTGCDRLMSRDYYLRWITTGYEEDSSIDKPSYVPKIKQELPQITPTKQPPVHVERKKAQVHTVDYQEKFVEKDGFSVVVDNEGQIITDMSLLAHLRGVRTDIAKEEKRPAYTIITNKGLVSLATYRPTTKKEFISLYGLGETTYQSFGNKFISAIKDFYNQQT